MEMAFGKQRNILGWILRIKFAEVPGMLNVLWVMGFERGMMI